MTSQSGKQTIAIHIFPNISAIRQSDNESWSTRKKKTFFWKNDTQNVVEKLFPDPFLKNQN